MVTERQAIGIDSVICQHDVLERVREPVSAAQ